MSEPKLQSTLQRLAILGGFIAIVITFTGGRLLENFDAFRYEAKTSATAISVTPRGSVTYSYSVSGASFTGSSYGGRLLPVKAGETIEIHYSTKNPSHSTIESPSNRLVQFAIIFAIAAGVIITAIKTRKGRVAMATRVE